MKKLSFVTLIAIFCFVLNSCTKESVATNTENVPTSNWTISGISFQSVATYEYDTALRINMLAAGTSASTIFIMFNTPNEPTAGTYQVVSQQTTPSATQCIVYSNIGGTPYYSTGVITDSVRIMVTAGKITATFTNITEVNAVVSGTLIQN